MLPVCAQRKPGISFPTLQRYVAYQQQAESIRKQIVAASIYPAVVMVVGLAVAAFLLLYLVPKFSRIYGNMNTDLPFLRECCSNGADLPENTWHWCCLP